MSQFDHNSGDVLVAPGRPDNFSMTQVDEILRRARQPRKENPPVLMIKAHQLMQARNDGFPRHMYHADLDPVVAITQEQVDELEKIGYGTEYIRREYPKTLYRRNMADRFAPQVDPATKVIGLEFVESRTVRSKADEETLLKGRRRDTEGPWRETLSAVDEHEPLPSVETFEAKSHEVSHLRGQIEVLQAQLAEKVGRRKSE